MMTEARNADALKIQIRLLLAHFQELEQILGSDHSAFAENNTQQIELNNARKSELLEHISRTIQTISGSPSHRSTQSFMSHLEELQAQMDKKSQEEITNLLNGIRSTIQACERNIAVNSNIIYTTLNHIKQIWDDLLVSKPGMECVYDNKGQTQK